MKKGPGHTAEEALKVFRAIASHLEQNPDLLRTDGVFRLSANSKNPPEIIKRILKKKSFTDKGYSVHDLIGALKESLKNNVLINTSNPHILPLLDAFAKVETSNEESVKHAAAVINQLIEELAASGNKHDLAVAEILHTYLHLTHLAASYSENNRMTPTNLAVAAIGPLFLNNIIITKDPMEMMSLTAKATPVSAEAIQSNRYDFSFKDRHHEKVDVDPRRIIEQLEENLRVLADQRDRNVIPQAVYDKMVLAISQDVQRRKEEISRFALSSAEMDGFSSSSSPSSSPRSSPSSSSSSGSSPSSSPSSSPRSSPTPSSSPVSEESQYSTRRSVRFLGDDGIPKASKSRKGSSLYRSVSSLLSVKKPADDLNPDDTPHKKSGGKRHS